jgi:hypothetical protein
VKKSSWRPLAIALTTIAAGCAAPASKPQGAPATPTPYFLSRTNPNIVEEDDVHIVERFPKDQYIRVDDRHIKHPLIGRPVEFYKEDDQYYYVYTYKRTPELLEAEKARLEAEKARRGTPTPRPLRPGVTPTPAGPPLADFENLLPPRQTPRVRLEPVADSGLPGGGLWRASFEMADMNGDGIPDIVAPPSRIGDGKLHVWTADRNGHFSEWPVRYVENDRPRPDFSLDYGGVAVGDIDGDGKLDVVAASHSAGLVSLFGDGKGTFRIVRTGLPGRDFSSQAVALLDADGDGHLDIVASRDIVPSEVKVFDQLRVYLYRGAKGWEYKTDGIVGGLYSNSLTAWDFDGDGRKDVLTGSHFIGGLTLLWKNTGNGTFAPIRFPEIEIYAYHFASAAGTFGRKRSPAFADAYYMFTNKPKEARATGITLYVFENGGWAKRRVWRKKSGKSSQYALAMGDLDGDGLDDIVFPDSEANRLRVFFQKPDGTFTEMPESEEPALDSMPQCVRLADVNGDGRLDVVLSKTAASYRPEDKGGWSVYLNRAK